MSVTPRWVLPFALLVLTASCSSGNDKGGNGEVDTNADTTVPEQCDETKRPILFVHGIMGGGDNFELQAQRFRSNGYCSSAIRAFDYDATFLAFGGATQADTDATQAKLDAAVEAFIADSGFDQIDLVGHSFGTVTSHTYLSDPAHAAKIAHYAQAAGGGLAEPVPQVNLSSDGDYVVTLTSGTTSRTYAQPGPTGTTAENPDIGHKDHVGVLTCKESFAAMYQLFNGSPPAEPDVVPEDHVEVSGFYKNFSDNTPHPGVTISIYELDAATGERLHDKADFAFKTDQNGAWGPFVAKADARYEFFEPDAGEAPADGQPPRPQHTYRGPFKRSTHLMYLKALPTVGSFAAGLIVGHIQYTDSQTGFILQNSHRAMISKDDPGGFGMDSLTVNGSEILTADVAPESRTVIALFGFDANMNNQSDLTPIADLSTVPFLGGVDVSLPTSESSPVELVYNGFTVHVPRWKSDTEGSSLILLDN